MEHQKELIIITTRTVQGKEPFMKEVDINIRKSVVFNSDSQNGDVYGGLSNRKYYFTSKEKAIADVKEQARVWLNQQEPIVCSE